MSAELWNALIIIVIFICIAIVWFAQRIAMRANMMSAMMLMERVTGGKHANAQLDVVTNEVLDPQKWHAAELFKAVRLAGTQEMNKEIFVQGHLAWKPFLQEIKTFADKLYLLRGIVDEKGELLVGLMRVHKGNKFFNIAFRVDEREVREEVIPKHLRDAIQLKNKHTKMYVIWQLVISIGEKSGYEVKQDFIDTLLTKTALPDDLSHPNEEFRFSRFVKDRQGMLQTRVLQKDPTVGYMTIHENRNLTLRYHGDSYLVPQGRAIEILADKAVINDRSTVILSGSPNSGKTAFMAHLQRILSVKVEVSEVILGTGADLQALVGLNGRDLQNDWIMDPDSELRVIFIDDAIDTLEDTNFTQALASLMDGQAQKLSNIVLVLSVNRGLENVPEDLKRKGRMSTVLEFDPINSAEASALVEEISTKISPPKVIKNQVEQGKLYEVGEVFDWIKDEDVGTGLEQALKGLQIKKNVIPNAQVADVPVKGSFKKK